MIIIIGCGWYGCHIAKVLKRHDVDFLMIEKNDDIFKNSSCYNQNRLHLGFHYPRSYDTRSLCKNGYDSFIQEYHSIVDQIKNNIYLIANDSIIDYDTYRNIYKYEKYNFIEKQNTLFTNVQKNNMYVDELVINSYKAEQYFKNELAGSNIVLNETVTSITKNNKNKITVITKSGKQFECDKLIDCTYNQLELSKFNYIFEKTISLLYERTIVNPLFDAITIMDGKFSSLYPRDIEKNLYTLTDVEHTPYKKTNNYTEDHCICDNDVNTIKNKMEQKFLIYYKDFLKEFKYVGYFIANKTKPLSSSDSRHVICEEVDKNIFSVNCGKIYGIFEFEKYILEKLGIE